MSTVLVEERPTKRARTLVPFRTKRPIDKKIISVLKSNVSTTQEETVLLTATFPCTITGLRWSLGQTQDGGTGQNKIDWAIVITRDGVSADTLTSADGDDFYTPEENVLVFGQGMISGSNQCNHWDGTTKTMRKLMGGDKIAFEVRGNSATNTAQVEGMIQFFCKT